MPTPTTPTGYPAEAATGRHIRQAPAVAGTPRLACMSAPLVLAADVETELVEKKSQIGRAHV